MFHPAEGVPASERMDWSAMRMKAKKTYSAKPAEVARKWLLIDAQGQVVGRLAADVAALLRRTLTREITWW